MPGLSEIPPNPTVEQLQQAILERDRLISLLLPLAGVSKAEAEGLAQLLTACLNLPSKSLPTALFPRQSIETDSYKGEVVSGKPHGTGEMKGNSGVYTGEWVNGKKTGQGEYRWNTGATYAGQWSDGKRNGLGVYKAANSVEYRGGYKDDKKDGWGVLKWPNGTVMYAEYRANLLDGVCFELCPDGKTVWLKHYAQDKLDGAWKRFDLVEHSEYEEGVLVE